jgi:GT2 family glycosyltransferase
VTITVITPWVNHRELERDYWAAMRAADARVIVIDNGSDPPLPNAVRLRANLGSHRANNIGLDLARTDALLFLNNDIVMRDPAWLASIVGQLEQGVLVGAEIKRNQHGDVDGMALPYLDGWCLAGMKEDLEALGGWDESFAEPAYFGDNDLCFRARLEGMVLRQAHVGLTHLGNTTAGRWDDPVVRAASEHNYRLFADRVRQELGATIGE